MAMPSTVSATPTAIPKCIVQTTSGASSAVDAYRAPLQHDLHVGSPFDSLRLEAAARHRQHQRVTTTDVGWQLCRLATTHSLADLEWRMTTGADHFAQQQRQSFVRSGDTPPARGRRVRAVHEPRASATNRSRALLHDQICGDQFREVLSDRVVIERKPIGQLRDPTGSAAPMRWVKIAWRVGSPSARACSCTVLTGHTSNRRLIPSSSTLPGQFLHDGLQGLRGSLASPGRSRR